MLVQQRDSSKIIFVELDVTTPCDASDGEGLFHVNGEAERWSSSEAGFHGLVTIQRMMYAS